MPKDNVTIKDTDLLSWDEYKDAPVDVALPSIYAHAGNTSWRIREWYWQSIASKKRMSLAVRGITFFGVLIGTACPIVAGLLSQSDDKFRLAQAGIIVLAVAAMLQVADRVFGWSTGWLRYVTTVTAMENSTHKFELDWADYIVSKSGALADTDKKPLFDLAKQLEEDVFKLRSDETDKWAAEFVSGTALLGELIKSQRDLAEKNADAARVDIAAQKAAAKTGAVELTLTHKPAGIVGVTIELDGYPAEQFTGTVWSKLGLEPRQYTLTVSTADVPAHQIIKVVTVPPGGVAAAGVTL